MVNYNNILKFSKGDILKISKECYRVIDDYDFNFCLKKYGDNINWEKLKKLALLED